MPTPPSEEKQASPFVAVRVVAPARAHLGFLDLDGSLGRKYGGAGLALDRPATKITLVRSAKMSAEGPDAERASQLISELAPALGLAGAYGARIEAAIPAHSGLGSGTQLALAIAAAMLSLEGRTQPLASAAALAGRGGRSAIGLAAFEGGGFIVDGGRGTLDAPPPILSRVAFPDGWRVLLVLDRSSAGVHGDRETRAFANLRPFPAPLAAHLCRLVLMRLLPGLIETDIAAFGSAVTEIQSEIGAYFAFAQGGGAWTSPAVRRVVERLGANGAVGLGQTSWGPTGFAFAASEDDARRLYQSAAEAARGEGLEILIARGRNSGARVEAFHTLD